MNRFLALFLLAVVPGTAQAAGPPRSFTITSFDRIRMEAPFEVTLATGRAPFARAEGSAAALDTIDLRVEGRTLIVRQRSGWNGAGNGMPLRLSLGTPDLRSANLIGSGRLAVDRMRGLAVSLALAGTGQLKVADLSADSLNLLAGGSGIVTLGGAVKNARISTEGRIVLEAGSLTSEQLVLVASGNSEVTAAPRRTATITASGGTTVALRNPVACVQKVTGASTVTGCR